MRKGIPYGQAPHITLTNAEWVCAGDYFLDESQQLEKLIKSELSNKQERGLNMRARWCLDG